MTKTQRCLGEHPLSLAHSAQVAASGQMVYVVCGWQGCPQRRLVAVGEWDAELARRQEASAGWERGLQPREETA